MASSAGPGTKGRRRRKTPASAQRILVRRAGYEDLATLIDLMREFYAESNYPLDAQWANAAFAGLIENPTLGCVSVAELEESPIGHCVLTLRYTMEHGALSGHIDDLFVRPAWRQQGVARALLSELMAECRRRGCKAIYVEVGSQNVPAMHLYREFGLAPFEDGRVLLSGTVGALAEAPRRADT